MSWIREANSEPIPGYRLIEPLGSGGFGEVWKCEAPGGLFKAIKFVYGNLNSVDLDGIRAEQEWKALQRIKEVRHPFVCSVERMEFVEGELMIVMELADQTLHDLFQERVASGLIGIPGDDLFRYLRDAAEALDYMHAKHNLQHLDVKPRNLFLIGDRVKVADFGLVKCLEKSQSSGILGGVTPLYAPPETYQGKISPQSDQYSLAIVYQELLTGHRPFQAKNIRQMAQMHMEAEPDLRSLPEPERPVIARALAKDPSQRYPKCMEFMAALYKARSSLRLLEVRPQSLPAGLGQKPKTLAETMEDVYLPGVEADGVSGSGAVHALLNPKPSLAFADDDRPDVEVSDLGVTVVQPESGALRPTLVIGLGTFGRKALMELRCRFLDRFGDLNKLPLLRFLYLDTDPDSAQAAFQGAPEVALGRNDYYPLPLQPVVNYRRRSLDQLAEWLPRDKLYGMPRSLQTQGSRALGRLAYADNQQRLLAKLRRELQEITNPDTLYKSVERTGLALNNNVPRIYVISAGGGGSSGMLPDLGYALRRLLANLRQPEAKVIAMLMCGASQDPATPRSELANVYATLTELNHFSDPAIPFAAQYGSDGQRIVDEGSPFHSVYLLPLAHRNADALNSTVGHLGSYLFHELTTPLGVRLDQLRQEDDSEGGAASGGTCVPLRSFGTYAVWFPRGLLLNVAARHACKKLIDNWVATDTMVCVPEVQTAIQRVVANFVENEELAPGILMRRIETGTQAGIVAEVNATPGEVLNGLLAKLEDQLLQSIAQEDPINWAKQAMGRLRDWMGTGGDDQEYNEWRKTKLARALAAAAQKIAEQWEQRIGKEVYELLAYPGARVAGAEIAMDRLHKHFQKAAEAQIQACNQRGPQTAEAWRNVEAALQECMKSSSGFRLFGSRSKTRQLRHFLDQLFAYAHTRLAEELMGAVRQCYLHLLGKLADRQRDLGFCRQRLRHLKENLDRPATTEDEDLGGTRTTAGDNTVGHSPVPSAETFWDMIRESATARVVLPEGQNDLEQAALRFLHQFSAEQWLHLDKELHEKVLEPQGGLSGACMSGDLTRQMAVPLLEGATQFLNQHLPIMDVAQIIKGEVESGESCFSTTPTKDIKQQTQEYLDHAVPGLIDKAGKKHHAFLLVPASSAGKSLGEAVHAAFPGLKLVRVPGQSDLMFLREQGNLGGPDLLALLKPCRAAYESSVIVPTTSSHARFDVTDWLPLEP